MNSHRALALLLALLGAGVALALPAPAAQAADPVVIRVTEGGAPSGECGADWAHPCGLQHALTAVATSGDELWVAAGTYKPTTGTDRTATFQLKNGVKLYGGFAGTEMTRRQRSVTAHVTILSGNLGAKGNLDNAYHVVTGTGTDATAVLDGFTVTGGNANGLSDPSGGGMLNSGGSPTVRNVTFSANSAQLGGGMYNYKNSPALTNVTFSENSASERGGGMYNLLSSPTLTDVTFHTNTVDNQGGGMYNYSGSPTLTGVTFNANTAVYGGGIYNDSVSSPALTNVTFHANTAAFGGGVYNDSSSPALTNVTFYANYALQHGGGLYNINFSDPVVQNCILWGNTAGAAAPQVLNDSSAPVIIRSVVQGGCPPGSTCTGLLTADPHLGALGDWGGFTQTIPLLPGSVAIDAGDAEFCPETDQRGVVRLQGAGCDLGAYEAVYVYLPVVVRQ